jgi:hypothetical protein
MMQREDDPLPLRQGGKPMMRFKSSEAGKNPVHESIAIHGYTLPQNQRKNR